MKINHEYESPALEVVEIEAEQSFFAGSYYGDEEDGDGIGEGEDWPDFE